MKIMSNTIATYKTEAAIATGSAISLGTTNAPEPAQTSFLSIHVFEFGHYYASIGDLAAIVGAIGVVFVMLSSGIKWLKGNL